MLVNKEKEMYGVGKVFSTKNFGDLVVTKYINSRTVHVKFIDTGYETATELKHIRTGQVKDRWKPSVFGVGVIGELPISHGGKHDKEYVFWKGILERCYDEKYHSKYPTYKDCCVSEDFKYYPYFKGWCNKQIGFDQDGWHLDKDILVKGNKAYSEDTCCFVPSAINNLFVKSNSSRGDLPIGVSFDKDSQKYRPHLSMNGKVSHLKRVDTVEEAFSMYKHIKEGYIKDIAEKYKGQIDKRVYQALLNYKVEITD